MTENELIQLEELVEAATPGPWAGYTGWSDNDWMVEAKSRAIAYDVDERDALFIAAAREAVPKLIAEMRRLKEEVSRLHWERP